MQINESYCRVEKGEVWLLNSYIAPYSHGNELNHVERRNVNCFCMQRNQPFIGGGGWGGKTLVPLRVYFKDVLIKVEIALCVGKKVFDKRETIA